MRADGILNAVGHDEDERGYSLILLFDSDDVDLGELSLRVGFAEAQHLFTALEPLRDWVNEGLREHAAYNRATPEERAEVLWGIFEEDPYEAVRVAGDLSRKAAKENR